MAAAVGATVPRLKGGEDARRSGAQRFQTATDFAAAGPMRNHTTGPFLTAKMAPSSAAEFTQGRRAALISVE
jgi:hypothetical protein